MRSLTATGADLLASAARNNAVWCDMVCRAHGNPGEFLPGLWINRRVVPRFYPNAITLSRTDQTTQLDHIRSLLAEIPGAWAIKDSFCALAPLGFQPSFTAEWIFRSATLPMPSASIPGVRWLRVTDAGQLLAWESTWAGESASSRIFLPPLLAHSEVAILAAYHGERIVAGAIANRASDVVGLSNIFLPAADGERFRSGCLAAASDAFPGLPLVGYERGSDLDAMRALGFEALGPLLVWVRS